MRSDMSKVITERERGGSTAKSMKHGASVRWEGHDASYDDQPKRAKASRYGQYGYDAKEFSDVLPPIYGYLRKQVGRPWNKVYSELCQNLDKRNVSQAHVFSHVFDLVGLNVRRCTDGIYREKNSIRSRLDSKGVYEEYGYSAPELYVHPRTGLLRKNKKEGKHARKAREECEKKHDRLGFPDGREWRKIDGIWYDCRLIPSDPHEEPEFHNITWGDDGKRYRELKRQLNKKELALVRATLGKKEKA